jgi:hypothetical protein
MNSHCCEHSPQSVSSIKSSAFAQHEEKRHMFRCKFVVFFRDIENTKNEFEAKKRRCEARGLTLYDVLFWFITSYGLKNASLVVVAVVVVDDDFDKEAVHSIYVFFRSVRWSVAESLVYAPSRNLVFLLSILLFSSPLFSLCLSVSLSLFLCFLLI